MSQTSPTAGPIRGYPTHSSATLYNHPSIPPQNNIQPGQPANDYAALQHAENALIAHVAAGNSLNATQEEFLRRMGALRIDTTTLQYHGNASRGSTGPILAAAASGAPINTSYGFARTEVRGVFVSGLDFKTRSQDLIDLFSKAGTVRKCQVHADNRGNGKGTATIEFATAAEATQAAKALNNFPWRGRTLKVRSDREAVVVKTPAGLAGSSSSHYQRAADRDIDQGPTIVDGSNSRQVRS